MGTPIAAPLLYRRKPVAWRVVQKKPYGDNVDRKTPFVYNEDAVRQLHQKDKGRPFEMNDTNSLTYTKWKCKYRIVFAPKYRRKVFYGEKRRAIGDILRNLFGWKKVRIV